MPRRPAGVTRRTAMAAVRNAHQTLSEIVEAQIQMQLKLTELVQMLTRILIRDDGSSQ